MVPCRSPPALPALPREVYDEFCDGVPLPPRVLFWGGLAALDARGRQAAGGQEHGALLLFLLWRVGRERQRLQERERSLTLNDPGERLKRLRRDLDQRRQLLLALSPSRWLKRGLALVRDASGCLISSIDGISPGDSITIQFNNGKVDATVDEIHPCTEPNRSCPQGKQQSHQRNQP